MARVSRAARIAIVLFGLWLIVFVLLQASDRVSRDLVNLFGLLPIWGPLLLIAVLSILSWADRKLRRR